MKEQKEFQPYIPASKVTPEITVTSIVMGIILAVVFGAAIALISCACGMGAKDGAKGVGIATTKAVVWSFVAIVIIDFLFAAAFFY